MTVNQKKEKEYLYWLFQLPFVGSITMKRLWEKYGSFEAVFNIEGSALEKEKLIPKKQGICFDSYKKKLDTILEEYYHLEKRGIGFVSILEDEYPKRLRLIENPPIGLYVKGCLPEENRPTVAIIGARSCSQYGRQVAEYMGSRLSRGGIQVISGLALGIDGAGHRGALREERPTYGVLGCGVNVCYPREHYSLYEKMVEKGGVLSECRLGEAPMAYHFPMRNRIISGLSDVILVVEAKERSGSLITVEMGLEQGKEIYAVPGPVTEQLSKGCNRLIKAGANIITEPEDILEYFQIKNEKILRVHEKMPNLLAKNEKVLYSCLDLKPKYIDQIIIESGLGLGECMTILLELELSGYVVQTASHYYAKKL